MPATEITHKPEGKLEASTKGTKENNPGEIGVWIFVLGDMTIFGLFFAVFSYYRALDPEGFSSDQALLSQNLGVLNTIILLLGSWFVVLAVIDLREKAGRYAGNFFRLGAACALGFIIVKIFEWGEKISAGINLTTSDFFMYYFIFTGLHLVHVVIGTGVLFYLARQADARSERERKIAIFESGAIFWHMVDLLWIVLFPLFYLMK